MLSNVIQDNGAYSLKVGAKDNPRVIPNRMVKAKSGRIYIADQLENECNNFSSLYYLQPFQKGFLLNWEHQRQIWEHVYTSNFVDFDQTCLLVTEPYLNFHSIQEGMLETLLDDFQFHSIYRCYPSDLSYYHYMTFNNLAKAVLVIDCGYSFTHIVPYFCGRAVRKAIRRIDVGGKLLTNHMKDIISYRQLNVMDETYVINQMKEDACFVSTDFRADMNEARQKRPANTIQREYALPDFDSHKRGKLIEAGTAPPDGLQTIRLNNERFMVPELFFNPFDIGLNQMGLSETVVSVVNLFPEDIKPHLFANIVVTGGSACFPGFRDRLYSDVRAAAPDDYDVNVTLPSDPVTYAWHGGRLLTEDPDYSQWTVTRAELRERGMPYCLERFEI